MLTVGWNALALDRDQCCQQKKIIEKSQNSFGLEETFKDYLVLAPCNKQGHLQPEQVAHSLV